MKKNVRKWQAIVFDLDDTLYPERDYVLSGFKALANWADSNLEIPAREGFAELKRLFDEGVRGEIFNQWLLGRRIDYDYDFIQRLVHIYRTHKPDIKPFPGVRGLLDRLRKSYALGLVSDGYLSVQQSKLVALDLGPFFDAIVFSDEWGKEAWKPNVKPFEVALEKLGVRGTEAIYVADNPVKDFVGARQLGMLAVWLKQARGQYSGLVPPTDAHAPHLSVHSLLQFEDFLHQEGREISKRDTEE